MRRVFSPARLARLGPLATLVVLLSGQIAAATFERPIPRPQTDSAEAWYFIASLMLVVALAIVQVLVNRR